MAFYLKDTYLYISLNLIKYLFIYTHKHRCSERLLQKSLSLTIKLKFNLSNITELVG